MNQYCVYLLSKNVNKHIKKPGLSGFLYLVVSVFHCWE